MKISLVCLLALSLTKSAVSFSLQPNHKKIEVYKGDDIKNSSSRRDVFKKVISVSTATALVLGGEIDAQALVSFELFCIHFFYFQLFHLDLSPN